MGKEDLDVDKEAIQIRKQESRAGRESTGDQDLKSQGRESSLENMSEGFTNAKGLKIFTKKWNAQGKPKGIIFHAHGFKEYSERYAEVMGFLNSAGWTVFSHDLQGHGKSEGLRAYVEKYEDYVDDMIQHIKQTIDSDPSLKSLPRILYGHSTGALIGSLVLQRSGAEGLEWSGAFLTSPLWEPDAKAANPVNKFLVKMLNSVIPRVAVPWETGVNPKFLTHDEEEVNKFKTDPMIYSGGLRIGWGHQIMMAMNANAENAGKITTPIMLVTAELDQVVNTPGAEKVWAKVSSSDKTYVKITGSFHEMHNEVPEYRKQFKDNFEKFLASHCTPPKACV